MIQNIARFPVVLEILKFLVKYIHFNISDCLEVLIILDINCFSLNYYLCKSPDTSAYIDCGRQLENLSYIC